MLALSGGSGGLRHHEMGPRGFVAMQQNASAAMPAGLGLLTKQA
jgi:hypothetical protein